MNALMPYSGSLLRLALQTIAIIALLAVGFAAWQNSAGRARAPRASSVNTTR
jgi:hypothetical protein